MEEFFNQIEALAKVCRAAGASLPDEEIKALQVGKVAEEAGEAMHALHGLKGLTTCGAECGEEHSWPQVQNDLVGAVIAAGISMYYNDPDGWRHTFTEIFHRRTRRGRQTPAAAATASPCRPERSSSPQPSSAPTR